MSAKKMSLGNISVLACVLVVTACSETPKFIVPNPINLQTALVLTERQRIPCQEITPKLGDDKLALVEQANIEIDDCETKRAAMQKIIDEENARREKQAKDEIARLNAATD